MYWLTFFPIQVYTGALYARSVDIILLCPAKKKKEEETRKNMNKSKFSSLVFSYLVGELKQQTVSLLQYWWMASMAVN